MENQYSISKNSDEARDAAAKEYVLHLDTDSKGFADENFSEGWDACMRHLLQEPKNPRVANPPESNHPKVA